VTFFPDDRFSPVTDAQSGSPIFRLSLFSVSFTEDLLSICAGVCTRRVSSVLTATS
jgi:hypothetical protein